MSVIENKLRGVGTGDGGRSVNAPTNDACSVCESLFWTVSHYPGVLPSYGRRWLRKYSLVP
eukprot:2966179-Amphidinium_carterae.1